MIIGAHTIVFSKNAEADSTFLRDVLKLSYVDAHEGWLIFGLPPAEVAVHTGERNDVHEFYLMCDDVETFVRDMSAKGIACEPVRQQGWGALTSVSLPGGGKLGVYQPLHARPKAMKLARTKSKARKRASPAKKRSAKTKSRKPVRRRARR